MKTKIMSIINQHGSYHWNVLMDAALKELRKEDKIETLNDANIKFMNEDYIFIKKGNPDNIKVITEGKDSYLTFKN